MALSVSNPEPCGLRRTPKTTIAAIRGLYEAVMNDNYVVLILSPNQRQSNILFKRMKGFIRENTHMPDDQRLPLAEMVERETQKILEFDNGSEIHALPIAEDGSNIRGFTAHFIIGDEAAMFPDEAYASFSPILATTQGTLMLLSSPRGTGNMFYKFFNDAGYGYNTYYFPSKVSPLITKNFLEAEQRRLPDLLFRQEYLGEFVESVGVMFTLREVDKAMERSVKMTETPNESFTYVLGYDPARFGDDSAVGIIIEKGPIHMSAVKMFEWKRVSIPEQLERLKTMNSHWNFHKIVIDSTGMGAGLFDVAIDEKLPVEYFQFSIKSKQEAYFFLKKMLESGDLGLPKNDTLKKQLCDLRREDQQGTGFIKIFHPSGKHDDYCTALVLATWGTKTPVQKFVFGTAKKVFC